MLSNTPLLFTLLALGLPVAALNIAVLWYMRRVDAPRAKVPCARPTVQY